MTFNYGLVFSLIGGLHLDTDSEVGVSARLHYVYNLRTDNFADPLPVAGLVYRNAQAGSAGFVNFAASYAFNDRGAVGLTGFIYSNSATIE
jgi:hypothetical protein